MMFGRLKHRKGTFEGGRNIKELECDKNSGLERKKG
jgi:hypothetical protein